MKEMRMPKGSDLMAAIGFLVVAAFIWGGLAVVLLRASGLF